MRAGDVIRTLTPSIDVLETPYVSIGPENRTMRADDASPMVAGNVYSLHIGTRDDKGGALASAMVAITAKGAEVLCDSRDVLAE